MCNKQRKHNTQNISNILIKMNTTRTRSKNKKQVRFSSRSLMTIVDNLSLSKEQKTKLWYSEEENDIFVACLHHRVLEIRSHLTDTGYRAFIDEEGDTINAIAILGLERYLSPYMQY